MKHFSHFQADALDCAAPSAPNTWFSPAQMTQEKARDLFEYRPDGKLYWRNQVARRRPEAGGELYRKRLDAGPIWTIYVGSRLQQIRYMRRYLVWNWHFGGINRVLLPANGDTLDDRVENIRLGGQLSDFIAEAPLAEALPPAKTGVICPCCGTDVPVLSANLIARAYELPPQQEAILSRVWQGKGKPVTTDAIISEMYADDPDGGPEYETARKYLKTQLCLLRKRISGSGVRIEVAGYQRGFKLELGEKPEHAPREGQMIGVNQPLVIVTATAPAECLPLGGLATEPPTVALGSVDTAKVPVADKPQKLPRPRAPRKPADKVPAQPIKQAPKPTAMAVPPVPREDRRPRVRRASVLGKLKPREKRAKRFEW